MSKTISSEMTIEQLRQHLAERKREDEGTPASDESAVQLHLKLLERTNGRLDQFGAGLDQLAERVSQLSTTLRNEAKAAEKQARSARRFKRAMTLLSLLLIISIGGFVYQESQTGGNLQSLDLAAVRKTLASWTAHWQTMATTVAQLASPAIAPAPRRVEGSTIPSGITPKSETSDDGLLKVVLYREPAWVEPGPKRARPASTAKAATPKSTATADKLKDASVKPAAAATKLATNRNISSVPLKLVKYANGTGALLRSPKAKVEAPASVESRAEALIELPTLPKPKAIPVATPAMVRDEGLSRSLSDAVRGPAPRAALTHVSSAAVAPPAAAASPAAAPQAAQLAAPARENAEELLWLPLGPDLNTNDPWVSGEWRRAPGADAAR